MDQQDVSTPGDQSDDGLIKGQSEMESKESISRKKKVSKGDKLIRLRLKSSPEVVPFIDESGKRSLHLTKSNQAIEVSGLFLYFVFTGLKTGEREREKV